MNNQRIRQDSSDNVLTPVSGVVPVVGYITGSNKSMDILVRFDDTEPKAAKLVANLDRNELVKPEYHGREALIVFENGDLEKPIILAIMENPIEKLISLELSEEETKEIKEATIDGERISFEAKNELILKCGKGSILIRKDGKIIVKGTNLLSRSSGSNKVKGASVGIN